MILEQNFNPALLPVDKSNMSNYPNILTPPSSSEDSPQPVYFVASPNSSSFHVQENYVPPQIPVFDILPQPQNMINPLIMLENSQKASLHFIEQPTDRFRFRYKSEMAGTHGSLTGYNSDKSRKQTYPTVELKNCTGSAIVRCSIYQSNAQGKDFMPHAHRLIMKKGKEEHDDPHDLIVGPEDGWRATFHGMGIIHTAKKNIVSELMRKKVQLKKEFIARTEGRCRELTMKEQVEIKGLAEGESKSINLNIVCLRFDAFIKQNDILFPICEPIYSHGINNLKSALTGELKIVRMDHCTSPARGGKEIFVLVERVTKKNIRIRFFELDDKDDEVWSDYGKFNDLDVHHQYAIVFKTPKYRDENITQPVKVFMELVRPTDLAKSEPREFKYVPSNPYKPGSKRPRNDYSSSSYDSSNIGSDELPEVISNLNLEQSININVNNTNTTTTLSNNWMSNISSDLQMTSADLAIAVNNIDSDELRKLFNQFGDYTSSLVLDAPLQHKMAPRMLSQSRIQNKVIIQTSKSRSAIKMEVSSEDKQMAFTTYEELKNFSRTNPAPQKAKKFVSYYLGTDYKTNALHVFVCLNNIEAVKFLLRLVAWSQELELVNIYNSNSLTPLQLAVLCHNEVLVQQLLMFKAEINKIGAGNLKMNTALHNAVEENVSAELLELLLSDRDHEKVASYINMTNSDGNTALVIAIENKNIVAMKLLCKRGADVNLKNVKNGYTPLRIAIEKQYLDMIKYLLSLPQLDATIVDFNEVSPLTAAHKRESSKEIMEVIEKFMIDHKLEIDIKEEVDEESDEESDEEMEEDSDVKSEPVNPDELEELYKNVSGFTSQCLDEVSALLNQSGKWEDLADLLDIGRLIRCGLIQTEPNVSKNLLTFAVESNNDTLWEIRNFLENLDEPRAVEIIDKMVQDSQ